MKAKTIIIDGIEYKLTPTQQEEIFIGELNGKKYFLGPEADKKMPWEEARIWCRSLGEGFVLPSRVVMLMCFYNEGVCRHFYREDSYWCAEEHSSHSSGAWSQNFGNGGQGSYYRKTYACYVRAVRVSL